MRGNELPTAGTPVIVNMELVVDLEGDRVVPDRIVEKFRGAGFAVRR